MLSPLLIFFNFFRDFPTWHKGARPLYPHINPPEKGCDLEQAASTTEAGPEGRWQLGCLPGQWQQQGKQGPYSYQVICAAVFTTECTLNITNATSLTVWILLSFFQEYWGLFHQAINLLANHPSPLEAYFKISLWWVYSSGYQLGATFWLSHLWAATGI